MKNLLDGVLNTITMYRLALYYVTALLALAFGLGFFEYVPHDPTALAFSTVFITAVCWLTNRAFALMLRVPVNSESIYITAFIIALLMPPVTASDLPGVAGLALASFAAIASKFLLTIHRKHVFNPVAVGVFASAMLLDQPATWWVGGNLTLLPLVLVVGLMVVRKVQRFEMFGVYVLANIAATFLFSTPDMYGEALSQTLLYSPLLFAGFAMLTEPLTAPVIRLNGLVYGAMVGALSTPNMHVGDFYATPEVAFLVGNVFAFAVNPKGRFKLTLQRVERLASGCYNFVFASDRKPQFTAGQYLDWTLDVRDPDNRGNRRPFTIASAPNAPEVHLGVKFYERPSAFKRSLLEMLPGDAIFGSAIAGDFTLPRKEDEKFAFIAGGIGVTPFVSMLQDMMARHDKRSVVVLYGNNSVKDIAYGEVLDMAERQLGTRTVYAVADAAHPTSNMHQGFIDAALIQREVPDFRERIFYISGPRSMVTRFKTVLRELGISHSRIKVDFFPGFA